MGFITFRIKDEIEFKSMIGGVSTIFIHFFSLLYTIYYSTNFLGRKNIDLLYSFKILETETFIYLTH